MYYIKQSEWKEMLKHKDYVGKSMNNPDVYCCFEGMIPGNNGKGGTTLIFEHKHFEIVPDSKFTVRKSEEKPMEFTNEELFTLADALLSAIQECGKMQQNNFLDAECKDAIDKHIKNLNILLKKVSSYIRED